MSETLVDGAAADDVEQRLAPEDGWAPLGPWPFPHGRPGRFVVGDDGGDRFRIRYYRDAKDRKTIHGKAWFGPGTEGPPLHAHGGSTAALMDEALGVACWVAGIPVLAGTLTTRYQKMLPLERVVNIEASVVSQEGRSVHVVGRLYDQDGTYTQAEGVYVQIDAKIANALKEAIAVRKSENETT